MSGHYDQLKSYIHSQWNDLLVTSHGDSDTHLGVPNAFIAPSTHAQKGFVFKDQFYWDTYFILPGLLGRGRDQLAKGMVDNLLSLQKQLGYIPNSNNTIHLGRSQPPMSSAMVRMVFDVFQDKQWLAEATHALQEEYFHVWLGGNERHNRNVKDGLSRYYNENKTHRGAEDESGWDYTTRFDGRALDFLPVDLNNFLYHFEQNIAYFNLQLGKVDPDWQHRAEVRRERMNYYFWNEDAGFFFDYDFTKNKQSVLYSLAGFAPLFSGAASVRQAEEMLGSLAKFETPFGLSTTALEYAPQVGHQWATPNGWAPLHYLVVSGLEKYGFYDDAKRIAQKWVDTVNEGYKKDGYVREKYNVVAPNKAPLSAVYPDQIGFAWTNAVTLHFIEQYKL